VRNHSLVAIGYRGIAEKLKDGIRAGTWPPGSRLPSMRAIAADHGVTLGTAAAALRQLAGEGWVTIAKNVGARVVDELPETTPTLGQLAAEVADLSERVGRLEGER